MLLGQYLMEFNPKLMILHVQLAIYSIMCSIVLFKFQTTMYVCTLYIEFTCTV
jgi:hypothetical protein